MFFGFHATSSEGLLSVLSGAVTDEPLPVTEDVKYPLVTTILSGDFVGAVNCLRRRSLLSRFLLVILKHGFPPRLRQRSLFSINSYQHPPINYIFSTLDHTKISITFSTVKNTPQSLVYLNSVSRLNV